MYQKPSWVMISSTSFGIKSLTLLVPVGCMAFVRMTMATSLVLSAHARHPVSPYRPKFFSGVILDPTGGLVSGSGYVSKM